VTTLATTPRASAALVACALAACAPAQRAPTTASSNVALTRLGDGVYAAVRAEPLGLAVNANSLLVVGDGDVVVVDAQFTRAATLETIAALRTVTHAPVRWVVNTHWHDDHVAGNQVYRDTFPGVRFVAHANTRADLVALGRPNRAGTVQGAPPLVDRYQRLLDLGLGIDSTPVSPAERASLSSALTIMRRYLAEAPGFREELPDVLVDTAITLGRGARRVDVRWFGRGNTRGDLVVHVPGAGVVATGDLVVAPVPFAFNSYPSEWVAVLDSVSALQPRVLVPGHGPVMHELGYLRTVGRLLSAARAETRAAVARGLDAEGVRRAVTLDTLRALLAPPGAGDETWATEMFRRFFRAPAVARLDQEARSGPLK
jgi:glyoxylase-like metal-dependent hydrolase (beta-lactamase superfamily II)